jgi:uncharacterized protein YqjF (DUF2071 family)
MPPTENIFLTANWLDLVMLNYEVDPRVLRKYVPAGTTLDSFDGKTYVSLVGFRFCRTKLFGSLAIPFHSNFDEVNLRFYVRRNEAGESRRGVVFIAEIVPKYAIAATARLAYGENYRSLPMKNEISTDASKKSVTYQWKFKSQWCALTAESSAAPAFPQEGTLEQFITEHYWGYSARRTGRTLQYQVTHSPWRVWPTTTAAFQGDAAALYGPDLGRILQSHPSFAFIAEGSPVTVFKPTKLS